MSVNFGQLFDRKVVSEEKMMGRKLGAVSLTRWDYDYLPIKHKILKDSWPSEKILNNCVSQVIESLTLAI